MEKIKIITLSDHPMSPSGVGTQTRYIIEGLLLDETGDEGDAIGAVGAVPIAFAARGDGEPRVCHGCVESGGAPDVIAKVFAGVECLRF